jgi:hypothetical protein
MNGIEERIAEVLGRAQALGGRESLNADNLADLLVAELGLKRDYHYGSGHVRYATAWELPA